MQPKFVSKHRHRLVWDEAPPYVLLGCGLASLHTVQYKNLNRHLIRYEKDTSTKLLGLGLGLGLAPSQKLVIHNSYRNVGFQNEKCIQQLKESSLKWFILFSYFGGRNTSYAPGKMSGLDGKFFFLSLVCQLKELTLSYWYSLCFKNPTLSV